MRSGVLGSDLGMILIVLRSGLRPVRAETPTTSVMVSAHMHVLIAEHDQRLGRILATRMATEQIDTELVGTGAEAIARARADDHAAIVLETSLPDIDGFAVCRTLREPEIATPILFLTARGAVADRVRGLNSGGDDYLLKPVAVGELIARVRAISRRGPVRWNVVLRV